MPNAGYATLQVIPSVRGISDELRRQLVGPAGDAGDRAGQAAGEGLRDKIKAGAKVAGVAAGAVLVAGITEAIDQANITSTLQAQLGTTGKVAAKHGKIAGKLYSTGVSDSFQGAADAIKAVVQAGLAPPGATNKQLQSMATKATDVATVFGQDLGGTANAVGNMIKSGLARNADEAFDILAKGLQSGADKGGDLVDTFAESSLNLKQFGFDAESAMGFLVQGMNAGAPSADALTGALEELIGNAGDSADVFASMGLNGKQMAADLSGGGPKAAKALDVLLDRFRSMKDPAARSTALVSLFGEEATAMQGAILALDPSEASKAMGTFAGSAKGLGDTLRSGPSYELQQFTRGLKQGFIEFLGGRVLPVITQTGQFLNTYLAPPIRIVASILATTLVPTLVGLVRGGRAVINWLRDMGAWLIPIAVAVGGLALSMSLGAIAAGANALAIGAVTVAMRIARGVSLAFAAAVRVVNLAMQANVIVLVITAIIALGVALVVAYKKSETFRAIVQGAFNGVLAVGKAIGSWFAGPFVDFFTKTIPNAFRAVLNWVKSNWPYLLGALTGPIGLAAAFIYKHWGQVRDFFVAAWGVIVRNVLTPIRTFFTQTIPGAARSLRDGVVGAVGGMRDRLIGIKDAISRNVIGPIKRFFTETLPVAARGARDAVVGAIRWLALRVLDAFGSIISGAAKLFGWVPGVGGKLKKAKKAFDDFRDDVNRALGGIKDKPVNVTTRFLASLGGKSVHEVVGKATGGPIHGSGTGTSDSNLIWASRGEHMWTAREVDAVGGHGAMHRMRSMALAGAFRGYAQGGEVEVHPRIPKYLPVVRAVEAGTLALVNANARAIYNRLVSMLSAGPSFVGLGAKVGPGAAAAMRYAQSLLRARVYGWTMAQWPSWRALGMGESGWRWNARNASSGAYGIAQALPPGKYASAGRDWRTNAATQIRWMASYIRGRYGTPARAYSTWLARRPHWYDEGGMIPPGLSLAYNGSRRPERVLTDRQWSALFAAARGGDGGGDTYNFYPRTLDMTVRDLDVLQRRRDAEARVGRPR